MKPVRVQRYPGRPFARPALKPPTGKDAPWFLKAFGSRPAAKLKPPPREEAPDGV